MAENNEKTVTSINFEHFDWTIQDTKTIERKIG